MSEKDNVMTPYDKVEAVIAAGGTMTDPIYLGGLRLFGIILPQSYTPANLTFLASVDQGQNWFDIYDAGNPSQEYVVGGIAGKCHTVLPAAFAAFNWLKIRSGTGDAPVAQAADRALTLVLGNI